MYLIISTGNKISEKIDRQQPSVKLEGEHIMLVKNWMTQPAITIDRKDSMSNAIKIMKQNNIKILPVMKKNTLVGVITDRDLKRASASDATTLEIHELLYLLSNIMIKQIMTKKVISIPFENTLEETAQILLENKISGAPVVNEKNRVIGVVTQADLFKAFISLTGLKKRGIQYAFTIEDRPGSIKEIADIIREHGGRMTSILTSYERAPEGYRNVYIRATEIDPANLQALTEDLKSQTTLLYRVDHRDATREIYKTSD